MKTIIYLLLVFFALSCSMEKRRYTKGYHITFHKTFRFVDSNPDLISVKINSPVPEILHEMDVPSDPPLSIKIETPTQEIIYNPVSNINENSSALTQTIFINKKIAIPNTSDFKKNRQKTKKE